MGKTPEHQKKGIPEVSKLVPLIVLTVVFFSFVVARTDDLKGWEQSLEKLDSQKQTLLKLAKSLWVPEGKRGKEREMTANLQCQSTWQISRLALVKADWGNSDGYWLRTRISSVCKSHEQCQIWLKERQGCSQKPFPWQECCSQTLVGWAGVGRQDRLCL